MSTPGRRIRERREAIPRFKTQKDLADAVGVPRERITLWETDKSQPSGANLTKLARVLNVTPEWLLEGDDGTTAVHDARVEYDTDAVPAFGTPEPGASARTMIMMDENPDVWKRHAGVPEEESGWEGLLEMEKGLKERGRWTPEDEALWSAYKRGRRRGGSKDLG